MQNQPGPGPRKPDPADVRHDRQAAGLSEDVFRGGTPDTKPRRLSWLRSPWKPVTSRLWARKDE